MENTRYILGNLLQNLNEIYSLNKALTIRLLKNSNDSISKKKNRECLKRLYSLRESIEYLKLINLHFSFSLKTKCKPLLNDISIALFLGKRIKKFNNIKFIQFTQRSNNLNDHFIKKLIKNYYDTTHPVQLTKKKIILPKITHTRNHSYNPALSISLKNSIENNDNNNFSQFPINQNYQNILHSHDSNKNDSSNEKLLIYNETNNKTKLFHKNDLINLKYKHAESIFKLKVYKVTFEYKSNLAIKIQGNKKIIKKINKHQLYDYNNRSVIQKVSFPKIKVINQSKRNNSKELEKYYASKISNTYLKNCLLNQ